jgi:YVTN family beta-propeller protein
MRRCRLFLVCVLTLCSFPSEAAPFAYITNTADDSVSVIDTATNSVVATIPFIGFQPRGVAVSPTGAFVYVTCNATVVGPVAIIHND